MVEDVVVAAEGDDYDLFLADRRQCCGLSQGRASSTTLVCLIPLFA